MFEEKLDKIGIAGGSFFSDPFNLGTLGPALAINIIHWIFLYIKIKPDSSTILLHYNVVYGTDLLEQSWYAYAIPAAAAIIFLFNLWLSVRFYKKEKLASYFLNFSGLALQLIFVAATIILVRANLG